MFNFFNELKKNVKNAESLKNYNIINISNKIIYVEGHKGLVTLSKEIIAFKVKNGRMVVEGSDMFLLELTENTIKISGKVKKMELF